MRHFALFTKTLGLTVLLAVAGFVHPLAAQPGGALPAFSPRVTVTW